MPVGWVTGALVLFLARPSTPSLVVGMSLAAVGESLRIWASGHLEKTLMLATGGPYAHTRNPLYLGSVLMALGMAAAAASPWVLAVAASYLLAFYPVVIRKEEVLLREKFGPDYAEWAASVPPFLPRLTPGGPRASRFEWRRVRRNREWRAVLALPPVAALLWARTVLH